MNHKNLFDLCLNDAENIFLALSKDLLIINANQIVEEALDCKKCELINQNIIDVFNKKFSYDFPKPPLSIKKTKITTIFKHHITNEETTIIWEIIPFPKKMTEDGMAFWMIGKIANTLAIKQKEQLKFHNLVKYAPGLFYWKDRNSVYQGCNDEFAKLAGIPSRSDVVGKTDYDLPWKDRASDYIKNDQGVISTGVSDLNREEMVETVDKKVRNMITNKVPLLDDENEIIGVLGITTDITHQKKIEEELKQANRKAEAASKAKSEFIANMSHDIRTPITGIVGMVQDLLNTAHDTKTTLNNNTAFSAQELIKLAESLSSHVENNSAILMDSIDQLLQLCNEILEVTRLDHGKLDKLPETFEIHDLVQRNIELLIPVARNKKLTLAADIDNNVPKYLSGLKEYVSRSLLNLLSNSLKFTKKGYVKLKVLLAVESPKKYRKGDEAKIIFIIEDTGIGIPADKFDAIFEHFSRLTPSYEGIYKGSGLGLYTVKRYVEAMNGNIEVESKVGHGTKFKITLPFVVSDEVSKPCQSLKSAKLPAPASATKDSHDTPPSDEIKLSSGAGRVLIVEDNNIAAMAVKMALKPFQCAVDFAENGKLALDKVKKNNYTLILMDIGLPDISGIEVTKKIRKLNNEKSKTPIVALTGHASDAEMRQDCLDAGMQDVLTKPTNTPQLEFVFKEYVLSDKDKISQTGAQKIDKSIADIEATAEKLNDEKVAWEVFDLLCQGLPLDVKEVKAAQKNNDVEMLRRLFHRIRGGLAYFKAPQLETATIELHDAVKSQPLSELNDLFSKFYQAAEAILTAYKGLKRKP